MNKLILLIALSSIFTIAYVNGECANACSGHGECGEFDACFCHRNYRGADCSERVCPYGHAFITTPQGDVNSDGDRADNTWKRLSVPVQVMKINSDTITLAGELKQTTEEIGATNIHRHEVGPGDTIRIGNQVMQVTECRDSTAASTTANAHIAYTCNRILIGWGVGDYDSATDAQHPHRGRKQTFEFGGRAIQDWSGYSIFKWIGNQFRPEGTWEQWPGDFYGSGQHDGAQDEGHFYMECSNRGLCDRKSGECECFDGYTGIGCNRLACAEGCSGHGTCETVDELRRQTPAWQSFSVQTFKDSDQVQAEIEVDSTANDNVVLLRANDYIKIGNHPPMKVEAVSGTVITLYSTFPETLPYGTHAWKVFKYDLWDAKQNRACKCDAMWTGNDCSLRKCPFGDDPLTIVSYDPETEGTTGTGFSTAGTSGTALYTGYSPYRQKAERQTLEIDSFHRPNSGTFSLTFTDEYGDEWTTRPIPLVVRLSQTLKTDAANTHTYLDFGNDPGIHKSEVSLGDIIRIGNSYRLVTKLDYRLDDNSVLDTSLQYYQKIHFTTALLLATDNAGNAKTQQSAYAHRTAGTPVYRVTVAKEIREALKALPNDRITDVTVEAITRGGHVLDQLVTSSSTDATLTFAAALSARGLLVGDILRNGDEYRAVKTVTTANTVVEIDKTMGSLSGAKIFKQNGMKYDITFEQGCRTHEDCRYNGVDENDSDGPAQKVLYEGGDNNAAYCHDGGTCMCTDGFYGPGCTATGRGHHANNKVTVSGDVYNLKCDGTVKQENGVTQGLTASQSAFVLAAAAVTRVDPLKVTLSSDASSAIVVGDHIRIENQVRTVVKVATTVLYVDRPFEEIDTSDITKIFPQYTPVEVIADMGGVRSSCSVTDLRQLTSTEEICRYAPGTDRDVRACGHFTANQAAVNGRVDQTMREINPAHNIATSDILVAIVKTKAAVKGTGATASQFTLHADNAADIIGVKVGMSVGFKLRATGDLTPSFVAQGVVTQFDITARTFTVSALSSTTAFVEAEWNKADCSSADCCTGTNCQIRFTQAALKAELMDEREVEIGDRIRMLTSLGSWETRTVDSVTYTSGYQVNGFVVSEPYENTVSTTQAIASSTISAAGAIDKDTTTCAVGDFCKITGTTFTGSDGVYQIAATGSGSTTFSATFGKPGQQASQEITFTKTHLAYNDGAGTTEAKSCSGRGLCDDSSGECQCFKGYTGVDCSIQNALAV
jgi:hypothetical protein